MPARETVILLFLLLRFVAIKNKKKWSIASSREDVCFLRSLTVMDRKKHTVSNFGKLVCALPPSIVPLFSIRGRQFLPSLLSLLVQHLEEYIGTLVSPRCIRCRFCILPWQARNAVDLQRRVIRAEDGSLKRMNGGLNSMLAITWQSLYS